jgi:hypothetical protein
MCRVYAVFGFLHVTTKKCDAIRFGVVYKHTHTYRMTSKKTITKYIPHTYHIHTTYIPHTYHIHTTYIPHTYHIHTTYIPHTYHIHTYRYRNPSFFPDFFETILFKL